MSLPDPPRTAAVVAGCIGMVLVLGVVARLTDVTAIELDAFRRLNEAPDWMSRPLWLIMQLGSFWGALLVGVLLMAFLRGSRGAVTAGLAVFSAWLVATVVKVLVGRGRPADYLTPVNTRFETVPSTYGYVSGHTAVAFALATVVAPSLPQSWRWLPYLLALLVGIARIHFGAHLPLDVVGGAALGLATGLVARTVGAVGPERSSNEDETAAR